jgi:hypothetical protein
MASCLSLKTMTDCYIWKNSLCTLLQIIINFTKEPTVEVHTAYSIPYSIPGYDTVITHIPCAANVSKLYSHHRRPAR